MLEALGAELLGQVLRHLPPDALRSARQAARIFDRVFREHTEAAETMRLSPRNAGGTRGGPDWGRFPRLRRLVLFYWGEDDGEALRALFAQGGAGLASLRELDATFGWCVDAISWAAILKHAAAVTRISLACSPNGVDALLALLRAIALMAPHLHTLKRTAKLDVTHGARLIAAMPQLRSLDQIYSDTRAGGADAWEADAPAWEALPCSRLTSLVFDTAVTLPRPVCDGACWPQLRQLRGILLPGEGAAALARGLPGLEVLDARPEGEGAGAGQAAFGRVQQAQLSNCCASFATHARISRLLPAVERLTLWEHDR